MSVHKKPALAGASLLLVSTVIGLAIARNAPDVTPPTGIEFRDVFVDADGSVTQSDLVPTGGLEFRENFVSPDGSVAADSLAVAPGLIDRPIFVGADGTVSEQTLAEPPGIIFTSLEISPEGAVLTPNVQPPPGLVTRPVFIGSDGAPVTDPVIGQPAATPQRLIEFQGAWPNPFNPSLEINFRLTRASAVLVQVFDTRGRLVRTLLRGELAAELHVLRWDGLDDSGGEVASGSYVIRVQAPGEVASVKATLVK